MVSFNALTWRVSIGELPELEMAMTRGERSTTAGVMKVQYLGSSTTLTGMLYSFAATLTAILVLMSSVAAIANTAPAS